MFEFIFNAIVRSESEVCSEATVLSVWKISNQFHFDVPKFDDNLGTSELEWSKLRETLCNIEVLFSFLIFIFTQLIVLTKRGKGRVSTNIAYWQLR